MEKGQCKIKPLRSEQMIDTLKTEKRRHMLVRIESKSRRRKKEKKASLIIQGYLTQYIYFLRRSKQFRRNRKQIHHFIRAPCGGHGPDLPLGLGHKHQRPDPGLEEHLGLLHARHHALSPAQLPPPVPDGPRYP